MQLVTGQIESTALQRFVERFRAVYAASVMPREVGVARRRQLQGLPTPTRASARWPSLP
jgi:hypothetical protein